MPTVLRNPSTGWLLTVFLVVCWSLAHGDASAQQSGHACEHCGCRAGCQKVCRLVCEDKKVTVTCWGIQCEDVCLGGPGCPGCEHCEMVCGNCSTNEGDATAKKEEAKKDDVKKDDGKKAPKKELHVSSKPKRFLWTSWTPGGCGDLYTRKKLMKKTVTKTIPSYKWVVEEICPDCLSNCECPAIAADVPIPPPPAVDGVKVLIK